MEFLNGTYRVPPEVLATRPQTTAELWDSRVNSVPEQYRAAAFAAATLGGEIRRNVLRELVASLGMAPDPGRSCAAKRRGFDPALVRPLFVAARAAARAPVGAALRAPGPRALLSAAAAALLTHPQANTRRIVRQRVVNLIHANRPHEAAASCSTSCSAWNGTRSRWPRSPISTC